ncbi:transcription initiation factor IIF auxiliary subunit/AF-9 protein [Blumeria hordei DH14]|uniref:Protein AF-9 homolog n=1 Tax=Blumeria graminis f. sp. hordei (strain DH14) TaxID=546991 RepID=N1JE39_BLUG1|nr:transcription initiation factor IIF auxiliary subunit/AF-9 protein [Blumeria hordei DH14]
MAPPGHQKRVKGVQIYRPFIYGTTSKAFSAENPKPVGTPAEHTHSWTVFVKGVDDADISYWCKKVQFKLHDSIPNHLRTIEDVPPGGAFETHATGWGEFDISVKIYYVPESNEKPQSLYHHLVLHPYGESEEEREKMRKQPEIRAWVYEEQLFNEPYENFYNLLTTPAEKSKGTAKGTKSAKGDPSNGAICERTASIPLQSRPDQPFSQESERLELRRLEEAQQRVSQMSEALNKEIKSKEAELERLRAPIPINPTS